MPRFLVRPCFALFAALMLFAGACARLPQTGDYDARIGVAVKLANRVCMAIHTAKLLPSANITLLTPPDPEWKFSGSSTARAEVAVRDADACPGVKDDAKISSYNLEITSGDIELNRPLVAVEARVPSVYAAHSFHACTGRGGIHLTAWDGAKPLEGHRLWHQYYASRPDAAANCTPAEIAP